MNNKGLKRNLFSGKYIRIATYVVALFVIIYSIVLLVFQLAMPANFRLWEFGANLMMLLSSLASFSILLTGKTRIAGVVMILGFLLVTLLKLYFISVDIDKYLSYFVNLVITLIIIFMGAHFFFHKVLSIIIVIVSEAVIFIVLVTNKGLSFYDGFRVLTTLLIAGFVILFVGFILRNIIYDLYKEKEKTILSEENLKTSQRVYKAVVEDQKDIIFRMDTDYIITFVNKAFLKFYDLDKSDVEGLINFRDMIPKGDKEKFDFELSNISQKNPFFSIEYKYIVPMRRHKWLDWTIRSIYDEEGSLTGFQGVGQDITETKIIESVLKQSEEQFRTIFEDSPIGILIIDRLGAISRMNKSAMKILNIKKLELLQMRYELFDDPTIPEIIKKRLRNAEEIKEELKLTSEFFNKNELFQETTNFISDIYLDISIVPLVIDGVLIGYIANFIDITPRKKAEQELINLNEELEMKVKDRTRKLEQKNESLIEKDKLIESEFRLANKIQQSYISPIPPQTEHYNFYSMYKPMEAVGGDFYDYIQNKDGGIGVIIADVSGHGIPAALITSMLKISCAFERDLYNKPKTFLSRLNKNLVNNISDNFVTAFYGFLSVVGDGVFNLTYANAGHCSPLIYRSETDEVIELEVEGIFLGIFEDTDDYNQREIRLYSGDRIILYTDGLIEEVLESIHKTQDYIKELIIENKREHIDTLINKIYNNIITKKNLNKYKNNDDITIIGIEIK